MRGPRLGELATDGWDIASSSGEILSYERPDQIPIISKELYVAAKGPAPTVEVESADDVDPEPTTDSPDPVVHKRHQFKVPSRSVAKDEDRQKVYAYLMELARIVDPADLARVDVQLIEIDVTLTAGEGSVASLKDPLELIDGRWQEMDDVI